MYLLLTSFFALKCGDSDTIIQSLMDISGAPLVYDDGQARKHLNVAAVCLQCSKDKAENLARIQQMIHKIMRERPETELIVFGETILGWYYNPDDLQNYQRSMAETIPGATSDCISALADRYNVNIVFGLGELNNGHLYNTQVLINADGNIEAIHRKYHLIDEDNVKRYIPEVSGLEYVFSLTGGYFHSPKQMIETRFAAGNIHQIARVVQWHIGMNYFLLKDSDKWFRNFYPGGFVKFWDYYNRLTKIHFDNIAPYFTLGYLFDMHSILVDVRINQTVAVSTWSSLKHSSAGTDWFFSPWPQFLSVMPSLTISLGWKI